MSYQIKVRHDGLHKYRVIRAREAWEAEEKARVQLAAWDEQWQRKLDAEHAKKEKNERKATLKAQADGISSISLSLRTELESILSHALATDDTVNWNSLIDRRNFPEPKPPPFQPPQKPHKPELEAPSHLQTKIGLLRRIWEAAFPNFEVDRIEREKQVIQAQERAAQEAYRISVAEYNRMVEQYNKRVTEGHRQWKKAEADWNEEKKAFEDAQAESNRRLKDLEEQWLRCDPDAVRSYCEIVLQDSRYPDFFPGDFDIHYIKETQILIVELELPTPDRIPSTKSAQYVPSADEVRITSYKPEEIQRLYDSIVYQVALRTMHELFEADKVCAIKSVVFNGRAKSLDASTGKEVYPCILSVQSTREEFLAIDLARVDPAKCIRKLRGVAATTLSELTPIAPVLAINRQDARFVDGREVMTNISGGDNLAAMDWEQFEHLIRELFEKEFASDNSEVRVTRASRDGGVDAVIFDPDPLRGGKFVIQAKRYTNPVPVSAVRDLYGTVLNEGAVKGILVTTSHYGPDSYEFARNKPLTLLDGSNLLSMLEKHGARAHIDLEAARRAAALEQSA